MEQIQIQMLDKEEQHSQTPPSDSAPSSRREANALSSMEEMNDFSHEIESQVDSNRMQIFQLLLHKLGMEKTLKIMQTEGAKTNNVSNPEKSGKKQGNLSMRKQINVQYLSRLVQQSSNLEQMLQEMKMIMSNQPQNGHFQAKHQYQKLTKVLQELFRVKVTAAIPIFTIFNLQLNDRTILFLDINATQAVCLLDSRNCLHVIDQRQTLLSSKIDKRDITVLGIKWMNQRQFVIGTDTHKFLIYSSSNLSLLKTVRPGKMRITYLDMHSIHTHSSSSLILIAQSVNYTVITKLTQQNELRLEKKNKFDWGEALTDSAVIKIKNCEEFKHYIHQQVKFSVTNDIEHYYALNCTSNAIVKFDTLINQAGIIWKTSYGSVLKMAPSICQYYLHLIINSQQQPLSSCCSYQYIKINGHGSIIAQVSLDLNNALMGQNMRKVLMLDSDWLCCTVLSNSVIYFSVCTGKIVYIQEIKIAEGEQLALRKVGSNNCIVLQLFNEIRLLSTTLRKTKTLSLEYEMVEEQDEVMLQFARIRGIPGNFLHFLQSIRNQQR